MKIPIYIYIYTIQHTGTRFMGKLFETAFSTGDVLSIADAAIYGSYGRPVEHMERYVINEPFGVPWIRTHITRYLDSTDVSNKKLISIRGHHIYPVHHSYDDKPIMLVCPLYYSLMQYTPTIPVITPMRDPLLSIHTTLWRRNSSLESIKQENKYSRAYYAYHWVKLFLDMLRLPAKSRMLFPVDLLGQMERTQKLFEYCGLDFSDTARQYVEKWEPYNTTVKIMSFSSQSEYEFQTLKGFIVNRDLSKVNDILDVELEVLHNQPELKEYMQQLGYADLLWY